MPDPTDPFVLPELTRGLRHFAMPSALGEDHTQYFAPLLAARRTANDAGLWTGRLAAFDASRLLIAWNEALAALADTRAPRSAADRRAFIAALEEHSLPVRRAIDTVRVTGAAIRAAPDDRSRLPAWTAWVEALRALFVAADESWDASTPALAGSLRRPARWWRRVPRRT